jgi:hypothetical protein
MLATNRFFCANLQRSRKSDLEASTVDKLLIVVFGDKAVHLVYVRGFRWRT